jgi:PhnB protein
MAVESVPRGLRTVTASLTVKGAKQAIEFYKGAFGAELLMKMESPDGSIGHAELKIGDSVIFLNDEFPQGNSKSPVTLGGTTGGIQLYVNDVDASFKRAVDAGAKTAMPPMDMFWGDRMSQVIDPFGHAWGISTHKEDLTQAEMEKRAAEFWQKMAAGQKA